MSEDLKIEMSGEAVAEWEIVCDCIRQALKGAGLSDEGIRFVRLDGEPGSGFVKLPEAAAARLTRPWADKHLWPLLQQRLGSPSRALVDWLVDPANR